MINQPNGVWEKDSSISLKLIQVHGQFGTETNLGKLTRVIVAEVQVHMDTNLFIWLDNLMDIRI